jgi:hypothetical protein
MAAIAFPLDLIENGVFWRRSFRLAYRQEVSRVTNGVTIRKNLGRPLWKAEFASKALIPSEVSRIRANIDSLDGGIFTFRGFDPARCRPIAYPSDVPWPDGFDGTATLSAIYSDNKRVAISGLPVGYVISTGDLINIGEARLYSVVGGSVANADGVATEVEVRPWLWTGTAIGATVQLLKPYCTMAINPDELTEDVDIQTGRGTYTFTAWEIPNA